MIGYQTFSSMVTQVGKHIQDSSTSRATRIKEWINTGYETISQAHLWKDLIKDREAGVSTVAADKYLYLPKDVADLMFIYPGTMTEILRAETIENLFMNHGTTNATAGPLRSYAEIGEVGIKATYLAAGELLTFTPGGSAETFTVTIHGRTTTDDEIIEDVAITSSAAANSTNTWKDVYAISVGSGMTGILVVTGTTSTTEYATIAPAEDTAKYKKIRLWTVPGTSETVTIFYRKRVRTLVNDNQVPEIPVSSYLVHFACGMQYSRDRKWESAMQTSLGLAERALQAALGDESQGKAAHVAAPYRQSPGGRAMQTVVSSS